MLRNFLFLLSVCLAASLIENKQAVNRWKKGGRKIFRNCVYPHLALEKHGSWWSSALSRMAAFQGKQYLDISMSRPQRKNAVLVINPLKTEQAHVALRNSNRKEIWSLKIQPSVGFVGDNIYGRLFISLYVSVLDPESIQSENEWWQVVISFLPQSMVFFIWLFTFHSLFVCQY